MGTGMNKDIARKLIATVAAERKNANEFTEKDFVNVLSYKRKMLSENNIPKFIESARDIGLVSERSGKLIPNFNARGVIVPIDFVFTESELFEDRSEESLMDRLVEAISASGKMSKKEAIAKMKEHLKEMEYIDNEERLISIMIDNSISIDDFREDIIQRYITPK